MSSHNICIHGEIDLPDTPSYVEFCKCLWHEVSDQNKYVSYITLLKLSELMENI